MLLSLRDMKDSRTSKPKHKCSRRGNSQGNPLAISLCTFLYSPHRLELLFSFPSGMRVALNEFHRLESAYAHALFAIANAIDGSESFFLHHPSGYFLLSSFQDQTADGADDKTEDDDATDGVEEEQRSGGVIGWSERSCISLCSFEVPNRRLNVRVVTEADCE